MTAVTSEPVVLPSWKTRPITLLHEMRRGWARLVFLTVMGAFVALILASYAVPLWFQLTGDQLLVVTSGSMSPEIEAGDAVVIRQVTNASQLRLGQIVTFYPPKSGTLVTHRIVALALVTREDNAGHPMVDGAGRPIKDPYVRTRGDANRVADPNLTPSTSVRGIVHQVYPSWGFALAWAHSGIGRLVLFAPPLLVLAAAELFSRSSVTPADVARRLLGRFPQMVPASTADEVTEDSDEPTFA